MTEAFRLIVAVSGTCGFELLTAQVIDVMLSNILSVNRKSICKIFLHSFVVVLQEFCKTEFELVDKGINEFVS